MSRLYKTGYIYQLSFNNEKYKYVGSTTQLYSIRYSQHCKSLEKGNHCNYFMQNLFNKYNILPDFKILEKKENILHEELYKLEQKYIDSNNFNLNVCKKVEQPQVKKIKICQYDLKGNFIKIWDSAKDVEDSLNINATSIRNCIYKLNKSAGNYQWCLYTENYKSNIQKYTRTKIKPPSCEKTINIYDLYGNLLYKCKSRVECAKILNTNASFISHINNRKFYKGFFVTDSYDENNIIIPIRRVGKYSLKGELLKIYGTPSETMKELNKSNTHVFAVLNNKQKTAFGYIYRYINNKIIYNLYEKY